MSEPLRVFSVGAGFDTWDFGRSEMICLFIYLFDYLLVYLMKVQFFVGVESTSQ